MLPKKNRADKKAIEKIFKEGRFINSSSLTLKFLNNVHTRYGHARVSFIVPKTVEKKATRRNLLRRKGYLILKKYWNKIPNDFIGAIKKIPKKTRMMYVHAFQSLMFNRTVLELIISEKVNYKKVQYQHGFFAFPLKTMKNLKLPIIGFGTEFRNKKIKEISSKILEEEEIKLRDFIVRGMPELASEGDERNMFVNAEDINFKTEKDELNNNKKKCIISFKLPKGSYATIVIKKIFG